MKILINAIGAKKNAGGGLQIALNFVGTALQDNYHNNEYYFLISMDLAVALSLTESNHVYVFPAQPDFKHTYIKVRKTIKTLVRKIDPDVAYSIVAPSYFSLGCKEVMRITNPWVVHPNKYANRTLDVKGKLRNMIYCTIQKHLIRKCHYFVTQAKYTAICIAKIAGVPETNVRVISNVLPAVYVGGDNSSVADSEWVNVVSVTVPYPHKNLDIIPDVLKCLRDKHGIENVRFHVTIPEGTSILKLILQRLKDYGFQNRLINHGRMSQIELANMYRHSQMMFLPTLLEVFSASILEAMYFDLKIVASDFPFNSEVIKDAGLLFRPTDAEDAANKLATIIQNPELQNELSEKMKERLKLYRDYKAHFDSTISFLEEVAKKLPQHF